MDIVELFKAFVWFFKLFIERDRLRINIVWPETLTLYNDRDPSEAVKLVFQITNRSRKDNSIERLEAWVNHKTTNETLTVGVWRKEQQWSRPLKAPEKSGGLAAIIDIDLPVIVRSGHSVKLYADLYVTKGALPDGDWLLKCEFRDAFKRKHPCFMWLWDGEANQLRVVEQRVASRNPI